MSGRKGNLASRSLQYNAPETPNFLKALKAHVASSDRYASTSSLHRSHGDDLDDFVTSSNKSSTKRKAQDDEQDEEIVLDSDDELRGATVVVVKDGKHLSHEQALQLKKVQHDRQKNHDSVSSNRSTERTQNIAGSGSAGQPKKHREVVGDDQEQGKREKASITALSDDTSTCTKTKPGTLKQKGTKEDLEDVKALIKANRQSRATPSKSTLKDSTTSDTKKAKNVEARKLKARSGKGLSFDFDD
ncbi:uncharacterized protein MEPE_05011 [Melanopsichium pennsylvanicum]|uniref:DUF4604 domain-containing protein n=2 Tax=Melanopsichium pennsylvanicum TaxID=63383 RepID=A0AAJ4XQ10_9BASI|nr:conserved hypothetical protein [Melanopsichium pennsylvanicum 4]SNX86302.1 uncharacterized protein MEPE_05011 [Melanopsichium pennsylvanicum]